MQFALKKIWGNGKSECQKKQMNNIWKHFLKKLKTWHISTENQRQLSYEVMNPNLLSVCTDEMRREVWQWLFTANQWNMFKALSWFEAPFQPVVFMDRWLKKSTVRYWSTMEHHPQWVGRWPYAVWLQSSRAGFESDLLHFVLPSLSLPAFLSIYTVSIE